jgi:flagellar biosynthesis anti-sigma factor FlgM
MKIDPRIQPTGDLPSDPVKNVKKSAVRAPEGKSGSAAGDTFQVSRKHAEVQQLTAQLAQVPEVRAERVAPLKAAVERNSYQPDSGKVADAMLAEHAQKSAKA